MWEMQNLALMCFLEGKMEIKVMRAAVMKITGMMSMKGISVSLAFIKVLCLDMRGNRMEMGS